MAVTQQGLSGVLVLTGMPGSGKSTISRMVADRLPRSARISGDEVRTMIRSGRVRFDAPDETEAERQGMLGLDNLCALANNFASADFTPVLDDVVPDQETLDILIARLTPRPVLLVVLAPTYEICVHRNETRPDIDQVRYDFRENYDLMRRDIGERGWWLDSSDQEPADTVETVLTWAQERAVVAP